MGHGHHQAKALSGGRQQADDRVMSFSNQQFSIAMYRSYRAAAALS